MSDAETERRRSSDALRAGPRAREAGRGAPQRPPPRERLLRARSPREGLADVGYAPVDSPFGTLHAAVTTRGLVRLAFPEEDVDGDARTARAADLAADRARRPRRWTRCGASSTSTSPDAGASFELALDWTLIGPFGTARAARDLGDPLRRRAQLRRDRRRSRQPARLARGRQRAGLEPDPDRDPLPPRAAHRRRRSAATAAAWTASAGCSSSRARSSADRARRPRRPAAARRRLRRRDSAARRPLRLGGIADGHPLGRGHLGRVAQVPLGVERRLTARAGGRDRLAVGVVDEVAGGEHARAVGARGAALGDRRSRSRRRRSGRARAPTAARGRSR